MMMVEGSQQARAWGEFSKALYTPAPARAAAAAAAAAGGR